jgi:nucleotide-binding universal stress UspA family protein
MESSRRPIIVALDPRRHDLAPAALGVMIARLHRAPVVLAGAYLVDADVDRTYPAYAHADRRDTERAMRHVATLLADVPGEPVPCATAALPAAHSIAQALNDLAEREGAHMLVVGSSRRELAAHRLPSSLADRLIAGARCPVAVASPGFSFRDLAEVPLRIGVAFTETPEGHAALLLASGLAARGRGLVRVLTVVDSAERVMTGPLIGLTKLDAAQARERTAKYALRHGIAAVPAGVSADGDLLQGEPTDALVTASLELDLLVCGYGGHAPVRSLRRPRNLHGLLQDAACPVIVVRAPRPCFD